MARNESDYECMFLVSKADYEAYLQREKGETPFNQVNNIEVGHGGNVVIREENPQTTSQPVPARLTETPATAIAKPAKKSSSSSSSSPPSSKDVDVSKLQRELAKIPSDPSQREMSLAPLVKKRQEKKSRAVSKSTSSKKGKVTPKRNLTSGSVKKVGKSTSVRFSRGSKEDQTRYGNMEATPLGPELPKPLPDGDVEMEDLSNLDMVETVRRARALRKKQEEEEGEPKKKIPKKKSTQSPSDIPMETENLEIQAAAPPNPPSSPSSSPSKVSKKRKDTSPSMMSGKEKKQREVSPTRGKLAEGEKSKGEAKKRQGDDVSSPPLSKKSRVNEEEKEREMDSVFSRLRQLRGKRGMRQQQRGQQRLLALSYDPRDIVYRPQNATISREASLLGMRSAPKRKLPIDPDDEAESSGRKRPKELTYQQRPAIEYGGPSLSDKYKELDSEQPRQEEVDRVLSLTWEPERSSLKRKRVETKLARSEAEKLASQPKKGRDSLIFPAKRKNPFSPKQFQPRKSLRYDPEEEEWGEDEEEEEEEAERRQQ